MVTLRFLATTILYSSTICLQSGFESMANQPHHQTWTEHVQSDQTIQNKDRQPWHTKQTYVVCCVCLRMFDWCAIGINMIIL